jgi:5-methylcytosine-specific restriction endonuclease McrA
LSDDDLLRGLSRLLSQSRRVESDLVAHIAEVDERRLWARQAFPSMFAYCTGALRLSESEAYLRIAVGRASRAHPPILGMLTEGGAHLSGIALLAPHLTPENAERLLARAAFRSKREIEELVAELAPRPDARAAIRRLPAPTASPGASATSSQPAVPPLLPSEPSTLSRMGRTVTPAGAPAARSASTVASRSRASRPIQPLASDRYRVQFTATSTLVRKLERLCALMGPRWSSGDLAAVIDAVVSEKLERLEAKRFGAKTRSASTRTGERGKAPAGDGAAGVDGAAAVDDPTGVDEPAGFDGPAAARQADDAESLTDASPPRSSRRTVTRRPRTPPVSRHIPASVRRAVFDRDGGRCRYVDASGRRCPERDRLEYHHRHPFGVGGGHRPENLCLMCRAHNALAAEHDFGPRTMAGHRPPGASGARPP